MHFEILVEDKSGKIALEVLVKKILGQENTYRIFHYKGIGGLPKNLNKTSDPTKRILLAQLPRLLKGYGKSLSEGSAVIVVVDLDKRNCVEFKRELVEFLDTCNPAPRTLFRIVVEEMEAWFFGDRKALLQAYPKAKRRVLDSYTQDSICGTWEKLADAIYPGGSASLKKAGWPGPGLEKCEWAKQITPYMDIEENNSTSFKVFRDGLRRMAKTHEQ